jgi:hypothetical protein
MVCSCCGQVIKENKVHKEIIHPKQTNIIEKWLYNTNKIIWEYSNMYFKRIAWQHPLDIAKTEIKINNFYCAVRVHVINENINGRIYIRTIINERKKCLETIELDGINDITTDKIWDMINDCIINYRNVLCGN